MGRFYQTNTPSSVDFLYQPPFELMAKAIQTADSQIDRVYDESALLGDRLLKVNNLKTDSPRVREIQNQYQGEIQNLTETIRKNPLEWRRSQPLLRDLSRKVQQDLSTGELAKIQENYNKYNQFVAEHQKQLQAGLINAQEYNTVHDKLVQDFQGTGFDPRTGNYNEFKGDSIVHTPDLNKIGEEASNKIMSTLTDKTWDSVGKMWIRRNKQTGDKVTEEQVATSVDEALRSDPRVANWMKQGSKYGYVPQGSVDKDGNPISTFRKDKAGNIIWNENSPLTGIVKSRVASQAFDKTSTSNTVEANPFELQARNLAMQKWQTEHGHDYLKTGGQERLVPIDAFTELSKIAGTTTKDDFDVTVNGKNIGKAKRLGELGADMINVVMQGLEGEKTTVTTGDGIVEPKQTTIKLPELFIKQNANGSIGVYDRKAVLKTTITKEAFNRAYNTTYFDQLKNKGFNDIMGTAQDVPVDGSGNIDLGKMQVGGYYRGSNGTTILYKGNGDYEVVPNQ